MIYLDISIKCNNSFLQNSSINCDHSQGNYTKTQEALVCNYQCFSNNYKNNTRNGKYLQKINLYYKYKYRVKYYFRLVVHIKINNNLH